MQNILNKFNLNGKIALVTGGTSGLGFNMAVGLVQAGAKICVNDIRDDKLKEAKEKFGELGIDVFTVNFDVSKDAEVDKGISIVEKKVGNIGILVNNAGIIKRSLILEMPTDDFKQMMSEYGRNSVSAYASAKGGLKLLTKSMCCEWAKHKIQINGIGPGYIKTALTVDFAKEGHPFNKHEIR